MKDPMAHVLRATVLTKIFKRKIAVTGVTIKLTTKKQ